MIKQLEAVVHINMWKFVTAQNFVCFQLFLDITWIELGKDCSIGNGDMGEKLRWIFHFEYGGECFNFIICTFMLGSVVIEYDYVCGTSFTC